MSKKEKQKKQKKKFQLDYISSIFLASFLFAIAYDCFQNNKGQGYFTGNMLAGLLFLAASIIIVFRAIKDLVKKRREMLIAEAERREQEALNAQQNDESEGLCEETTADEGDFLEEEDEENPHFDESSEDEIETIFCDEDGDTDREDTKE